MLLFFLPCFLLNLWVVSGQSSPLPIVFAAQGQIQAGFLDAVTGQSTCASVLALPSPSNGCAWRGPVGTRGQGSASFPMNRTYFFAAQQVCSNGTRGSPTVFQVYGPYGPYSDGSCSPARVYQKAQLNTDARIQTLNMAWDHTCNIVVLIPNIGRNATVVQTRQVSEYDGAVRVRPDYTLKPTGSNCWNKVNGLGALDFGSATPSWPSGQELNCGDSCVMYTLEQCTKKGKAIYPRALIGKYYRTGTLAYNTTDTVRIQTLTWVSWYGLKQEFLGIGLCCDISQSWCNKGCEGLQDHLVLVKFVPKTQTFSVLADISQKFDSATIEMGVETSPIYSRDQTKNAYVYHDGTIITYALDIVENEIVSAKKAYQSPKVSTVPLMWSSPRIQ